MKGSEMQCKHRIQFNRMCAVSVLILAALWSVTAEAAPRLNVDVGPAKLTRDGAGYRVAVRVKNTTNDVIHGQIRLILRYVNSAKLALINADGVDRHGYAYRWLQPDTDGLAPGDWSHRVYFVFRPVDPNFRRLPGLRRVTVRAYAPEPHDGGTLYPNATDRRLFTRIDEENNRITYYGFKDEDGIPTQLSEVELVDENGFTTTLELDDRERPIRMRDDIEGMTELEWRLDPTTTIVPFVGVRNITLDGVETHSVADFTLDEAEALSPAPKFPPIPHSVDAGIMVTLVSCANEPVEDATVEASVTGGKRGPMKLFAQNLGGGRYWLSLPAQDDRVGFNWDQKCRVPAKSFFCNPALSNAMNLLARVPGAAVLVANYKSSCKAASLAESACNGFEDAFASEYTVSITGSTPGTRPFVIASAMEVDTTNTAVQEVSAKVPYRRVSYDSGWDGYTGNFNEIFRIDIRVECADDNTLVELLPSGSNAPYYSHYCENRGPHRFCRYYFDWRPGSHFFEIWVDNVWQRTIEVVIPDVSS